MTKPLKPIRLSDLSKAELIEAVRAVVREPFTPGHAVKDVIIKSLESKWRAAQQSADAAWARREIADANYQKRTGHRVISAYAAARADCERLDAAVDVAFKRFIDAYKREVEL